MPIFPNSPLLRPFGHQFERPFQSCAGWHPGGYLPGMGAELSKFSSPLTNIIPVQKFFSCTFSDALQVLIAIEDDGMKKWARGSVSTEMNI
ncbi:hypothetical protein DSO57_1013703 [Entomophthora muscae]|uniref:Uncharacterized protein n=1 Tax=Entomophthora muscae TaxID=34485 RepID=A0ACC2TG85_9FUNG|nr:hypothetical protein DSO57_1013703 [Entomophthora muscae]